MSGAPRNRMAYERGRQHREEIRAVMLEHARLHPLRRLTAKAIMARLPPGLSERSVRWHMQQIITEAELDCRRGNSSALSVPIS